jgi:hypothetical protein
MPWVTAITGLGAVCGIFLGLSKLEFGFLIARGNSGVDAAPTKSPVHPETSAGLTIRTTLPNRAGHECGVDTNQFALRERSRGSTGLKTYPEM